MTIGNKAKNLQELLDAGFRVPNFFVLPAELSSSPSKIKRLLTQNTNSTQAYAVRSSGTKEDTEQLSFAGQYFTALNVKGVPDLLKAVETCYRSVGSKTVQAYLSTNQLSHEDVKLAVIVQEMVEAEYSGVAFGVNPLTGNDKEIVIEVTAGLGEALVSGHVNPDEYCYNWYEETVITSGSIIPDTMAQRIAEITRDIQAHFGYPCDVEFAIKDDTIYVLQARAITTILYKGIRDEWTTADFRDGGVSSTVCTPFMWSLYEYVWEIAYRQFLNQAMGLKPSQMGKLGDMYYGRPYWNLSKAKLAMSKVPGYNEREFDNDVGVAPSYEGDGVVTRLTPKTLFSALKILHKNARMVRHRLRTNNSLTQRLLATYSHRLANISADPHEWQQLVFDEYLLTESKYFEQIFTNTVAQSIYKSSLLKHVSYAEYLKLLVGLDDISHLRPYEQIWELSRKPKNTQADLKAFIEEFGYHASRELDITQPHFAEEPQTVHDMIARTATLDDSYDPKRDKIKQQRLYKHVLRKLPARLHKTVYQMRQLLWWREELRDISTRYYYLIRLYTMQLADYMEKQGNLSNKGDIWYATIGDINHFIKGEIDNKTLQNRIYKNQIYYNSFRNYTPPNEIGQIFNRDCYKPTKSSSRVVKGLGCSTGVVTGTARVIEDISLIDTIQPGEILVTKFTDTGWTSKFAILGGVVTEYGGILCHAAIVSREYGIPCVVCAPHCTENIQTGQIITINGETGEVTPGKQV